MTRRLKKDGSIYFGPYFPASLAYRLVHLIHKHFLVPSCTVDLTRRHPRPCLQYYIHRCLGPCVAGLVTDERYAEAARDVRLFLEGRRSDLSKSLEVRMQKASEEQQYEQAAGYRDLVRTLAEMEERQKIAAASGDDTDVLAWYAEPPQVAVNLFHLRGGRVVDRRDFYWEDLEEFDPAEFLPSLLKQLYLDAAYLPRFVHTPIEFDDRELLEEVLTEAAGHRVEILNPQRGQKHAFLELVEKNAKHSFTQRFRMLRPNSKAIVEAAGIRTGIAGAAEANRVLRHLAYTGIGHGCVDGGVGRRKDEEIRLPEIHHSRRSRWRKARRKMPACCGTISPACAKRWSAATAACRRKRNHCRA